MIQLITAALAIGPLSMLPCHADVVEGTANVLSDGSYWMARTVPPALTLFGGKQEERIGRRMLDSEIAAGLATEGLKRLTRQSRPDDPNAKDGFPSGHAAAAWAMAEAAGIEDPHLRPYTYTFAAAVTWSRVELRRHTAWQAVAGAALGYGTARASASSRKGIFGGLFVKEDRNAVGTNALAPASSSAYHRPMVTLWEMHW
jgi:membrane-associated phospholipid phosphatase